MSTPSVAWAEYWRGRGTNEHFIAQLKKRIRIDPVSLHDGEAAAEALRKCYHSSDRNTVKHLVDALVMAHADGAENAVYTADIADFERLWDHFPRVRALVSVRTGTPLRKRSTQ